MSESIENQKKQEPAPDQLVDLKKRVKLIATKDAPHHQEGEEIEIAPAIAEIMLKNKWAKKAE